MTLKHRNRLLIAATVTILVIGTAAGPVFANDGFGAGLGFMGLCAIAPAAVLGVIAYIWHGTDKQKREASTAPRSSLQR
ncbi:MULTISPECIES: hypothetical protein [Microbacterium]|uniref:Uncharacterized protein n=1 Tax=Microbacterium wangchenii TaxID=2541726 RepID=A0ABX5SU23_9MICO|nr:MULTISPECIES: hypothetical protein [Microbacterium]MCK6067383.1 hypothetical protein [Microbacterium sp. EYE_512]QBR89678.1 hypothetical protein E4K62_13920 [Microbacterium wangchenii]TFV81027.1 hypothetical protein E4V99_18200 [Microbacterium sp. dk485]TXK16724.1 hypothetical protein FVP99_08595 [Microbacterium wangchenii]